MSIITTDQTPYQQSILSYQDYIYQHSIQINRLWEEHLVDIILNFLQPNTDFLDIGANIGLISLGVLLKAKQKQLSIRTVHCFECDTNTFNLLRMNTSLHHNLQLYPFAVSDKYELCLMASNNYNQGGNYIYQSLTTQHQSNYDHPCGDFKQIFQQHIYTPAIPLDQILYQFQNKISVIKIDVEGFEANVLNGSIQLIQLHRPVLLIEIWTQNFDSVKKLLDLLNYHRLQKICPDQKYDENFIAFPDEMIL